MSVLIRDVGMSTRVCFAVTALRIRVSMSAMGSVISLNLRGASSRARACLPAACPIVAARRPLPAALGHSRHVAFERQLPEAEAAQRELPHEAARPAAQVAAVAQANLVFR